VASLAFILIKKGSDTFCFWELFAIVCANSCVGALVCVCVCVNVFIKCTPCLSITRTYTQTNTRTQKHTYTHIHAHTHALTYPHTRTRAHNMPVLLCHIQAHCITLHHFAIPYRALQHFTAVCSTPQQAAALVAPCTTVRTLKHSATPCNTHERCNWLHPIFNNENQQFQRHFNKLSIST